MATRRSLILAGGGMKVAFQAGALQVWLDEAGLEFDHADAASGGVFNLAMLCQGMSGTEVADNWRRMRALDAVGVNWRELARRPLTAESLGQLDRFRRRVFAAWGLDFDRIRASELEATFNTYNFTRHELVVLEPRELTEDLLVSAVSLPLWFPPVRIGGETFIDSVYATDANVEEAIRRGADELWVIWTVSERSRWQGGIVGNYFNVIEAAGNGEYRKVVRRIRESNAAIERGEEGEFGRPIELRELRAEVPLNYIFNLNSDRFRTAVERGVREARAWCEREGVPYSPSRGGGPGPALAPSDGASGGVSFSEVMVGSLGERPASLSLTIEVPDIEAFVADPTHEAPMTGAVEADALGGRLEVSRGVFNLFVDDGDPALKQMRYRLLLRGPDGRELTLVGTKSIDGSSGRGLWHETTTLATRVVEGDALDGASAVDEGAVVAEGVVRITPRAFAKQLSTFRASGASAAARADALRRFGLLFLGGLWDVYARRVLPVSPV